MMMLYRQCRECPATMSDAAGDDGLCRAHHSINDLETALDRERAARHAAEAEVARLTAAGIEPSAEAALRSSAEAYRLVQEAKDMRAERDAFALVAERLRIDLTAVIEARQEWDGGRYVYSCCSGVATHGHDPDCVSASVAASPTDRGASLLAAADQMADALRAVLLYATVDCPGQRLSWPRAEAALDAYTALRSGPVDAGREVEG